MIETVAPRGPVLGADLGGTSTRVLVADADGTPLGRGRGGPGNPVSSPALAASSLSTALAQALDGLDPTTAVRAVLGVAGGSALARGPRREEFGAVLAAAGLRVRPEYVGDVEVAFAAGTASPDGAVLVAGTGASAGQVRGGRVVRTAAGHGWLLGDDGSGYWLGREAVRVALDALDAGWVPDGLPRTVLAHLAHLDDPSGGPRDAPAGAPWGRVDEATRRSWKALVVRAVSSRPPVRLADLARLVTDAAASADPHALPLVERAGAALVAPLRPLLDPGGPLVLAGGLVPPGSVVTAAVVRALAGQAADPPRVVHAGPGEAGAAWLALGPPAGPAEHLAVVRARLGVPG